MKPLLRVLVFVTVTALVLGVPTSLRAADAYLEGLRVVAIRAETPSKDAQDDQITKRTMEDQIQVTIRRTAPNLRIDPNADAQLYVSLGYLATSQTSYAAVLRMALERPVEIQLGVNLPGHSSSGRVRATVPVWGTGDIFTGSRNRAQERVRAILDELLREFLAAAYHRANL